MDGRWGVERGAPWRSREGLVKRLFSGESIRQAQKVGSWGNQGGKEEAMGKTKGVLVARCRCGEGDWGRVDAACGGQRSLESQPSHITRG